MRNSLDIRHRIDFWLLAGMIGLWVYWLFLYKTGLLDGHAVRFYLWVFWRNKLPVLLFTISIVISVLLFRRRKWGIGAIVLFLTTIIGYWEYGPDFPRIAPLDPPKILQQQTTYRIPVMMVISYAHEELPPTLFIKLQDQLYRLKVRLNKETIDELKGQAQKKLLGLAEKAGEDKRLFEKCLTLALQHVPTTEPYLPLFVEKRYEHVTRKLCWVFGFVKLQKEKLGLSSFWSFGSFSTTLWVAVRLRFPQKAWLTYLGIEPEFVFRHLLLTLAIITGYGVFLVGLRYVYNRWF